MTQALLFANQAMAGAEADLGDSPGLNYLFRLKKRMIEVGFLPDDELLKLAEKAYDSVQRLYVAVNYLASQGVGRPSSEE